MRGLFKLFKVKHNDLELRDVKAGRKEVAQMKSEFLDGINFEENPLASETPDRVIIYDVNGNEVEE